MTTTIEDRPVCGRCAVEFAPCDFTPFAEEDVTSGRLVDLREDPDAQAVALHWLGVFWKPDYSRVEVSGFVSRSGGSFGVWVEERGDLSGRRQIGIDVEGAPSGSVMLTPRAGYALADCVGRDLVTPLADAYLEARGFARGYPWSSECKVDRRGGLTVEIQPL